MELVGKPSQQSWNPSSLPLLKFFKINLLMSALGLHCCAQVSLAVESRDCPLVAVCSLTVVASLVAERSSRAQAL